MIIIDEIIISRDVVSEEFQCNLQKCKGACCWEGDFGAPLEKDEVQQIDTLLDEIKEHMPAKSIEKLERDGWHTFYDEPQFEGTSLMEDGACVFMGKDEMGISYCSIEKVYNDKKSGYKKPKSCHLYPIRVTRNEKSGFVALNYDRWDICNAACDQGKKSGIPVFMFVKEAIIRVFGEDFYNQLQNVYNHLQNKDI